MRYLLLVGYLLFATSVATSQESRQSLSPLGSSWQSLFNGQDLTGWQKIGNEKWVVQDGAIYGEGVTNEYGYLATDKQYQDFHLSLRFKCEAGGNSGV